jgi:acyl transferase domain-containing protein/SAM-dependent methyltransferase
MTNAAEHSEQQLSPVKRAILELRELRGQLADHERRQCEPIAIIGIGCRFPGGVDGPESFWRLLQDGVDAITEVPPDRWDANTFYNPNSDVPGKMSTRWGGFLEDIDRFDADFFGISPREAAALDPQQRLLLEVSCEALDRAGQAPPRLMGSSTGVFVGISSFDYAHLQLQSTGLDCMDAYYATGCSHSVAAGRVSYTLGLKGPSLSIDTACSSSLVAVHVACRSLRAGECGLALAGGVNTVLIPEISISLAKARMMAADGRCKVFDAAADGYVRGEGCGVVVLKRLSDAHADHDPVLAVIRGTAVNQDGRTSGLTTPNGPSQREVIRAALVNAGVEAARIGYVEAHGTGTELGDPIEVQALAAELGAGRMPGQPLLLGSVKSNIGHLEAAAGVAGLIKTVLIVNKGEIPPSLHFRRPNSHIPWEALPVRVPVETTPWPSRDGPRLAGLSSFGFSGTNAHVIVEEAPSDPPRVAAVDRPLHLLTVSARSEQALRESARRFAEPLETRREEDLGDVAYTANVGRAHYRWRLAVVAGSLAQARAQLAACAANKPQHVPVVHMQSESPPEVAFLFTGEDARYVGSGRQLYETQPTFRRALEQCDELLRNHLDRPLLSVLYSETGDRPVLAESEYCQPALFAVEYALAQLWRSWGIEPSVVLGYGVGEYVAACVAGVFSLEDGLRVVSTRDRLTRSLSPLDRPDTRKDRLPASHFDSSSIEPVLPAFERILRSVRFAAPLIPLVASLTGHLHGPGVVPDASYWLHHSRPAVPIATGMMTLHGRGCRIFLEIGPGTTLLDLGRRSLPDGTGLWLPSLRGANDWQQVLESLASLYREGVTIDWESYDRDYPRRKLTLPTYPFDRRRYWCDRERRDRREPGIGTQAAWELVVEAGNQQAGQVPIDLGLHTYAAKWNCLDRLATAYIIEALRELGAFAQCNEFHLVDDMLRRFGIAPTYRHLLGRWLRKLAVAGLLQQDGDGFVSPRPLPQSSLDATIAEARESLADVPFLAAYIERCGRVLPAVLTGKESALETLFPGGSTETAEDIYHRWPLSRYFNGIARTVLESIVKIMPHERPLRLIEVGAGTGGTTASLLPVIPAGRAVYDYTDVTNFFLASAADSFRAYPFVRYRLLDVEQDVQDQGYVAQGYDVVIAANSLHATRDLPATVRRARSLLAPGGFLLLYETTNPPSWFDISIAVIEGWQLFDDGLRRDGPILSVTEWVSLLNREGFESVAVFPSPGSPAEVLGAHVVAARVPTGALGDDQTQKFVASGDGLVNGFQRTDKTDGNSGQAPTPVILEQLAEAPPLERHELLIEYVRAHVSHVLRRAETDVIDRQHRLMDLGIDSLMAVELRNRLQTGLQLDRPLPATLVFDHPSVHAIASILSSLLGLGHPDAEDTSKATPVTADQLARRAELQALSDADVESLLMTKLDSISREQP